MPMTEAPTGPLEAGARSECPGQPPRAELLFPAWFLPLSIDILAVGPRHLRVAAEKAHC